MYSNSQATDNSNFKQGFGGYGRGMCGGGRWGRGFGGGKAHWMKHFGGMFGNRVPVNIEETDEAFHLSLYAAGLSKEAFTISVKNDVLTIAYKAPEGAGDDSAQYAHREHQKTSFERMFQLNEKVLTDRISATYTDGVLKVTLPKDPENNKPAQQVSVS